MLVVAYGALAWSGVSSAADLPDFTALVERQAAAVVNISTTQAVHSGLPSLPGFSEADPMFDFFRRFIPGHPRIPRADPEGRSLGSGFLISADGYILTNAHVVDGADEILVRLVDKRELPARLIGADPRSDVALLKIDAQGLPHVVLGDPDRLKVGEWVVAIGSPFGFDHSVTAGIVSAKGRTLPDENFVPFIQTDVAINPGNSGGPLFNLRGEVVGINSQIYSRTGGFMGLSFSIPIDVAMAVQAELREAGRVRRGRIGVAIQEVSRELAESFGLPRAAGALVSSVEPGGPAAAAGVEQGDVIVRFGGRAVESSADLPRIVAAIRPGERVELEVVRGGKPRTLSVVLGEWQDDEAVPQARREQRPRGQPNRIGLVVSQPSAAQRRERGLEHGLLVERAQGPAARAEIQPGDVILAVVSGGRQTPLRTLEEFNRAVGGLKDGQSVTLLVRRGDGASYVSLRAGE
ncbi:DegQ family serine endoprotease [Pseudothauera nasutitermitis]|uniref:Probable periplasmic serine endoprotease DegP-like n=2 Tax=Pseudothauera nasutitermitis TaxID=2565930 RepID=A0A4S4B4I9_9RHOO|nr:DegQ family serine endoprotease [Pseudothauera nasutitermitis]THF67569.1 DegQ family serine endoprotease [Pseudothauera nasutitermitis]